MACGDHPHAVHPCLPRYTFKSETDTEVLVQLIQYEMDTDPSLPPSQAVRQALAAVEGAFGCAIVFEDHPNLLIGMRRGSPLLLGIVEDGTYVLASDASAVVEHTQSVVYLEEDQMVCATPMGYEITSVHLDDTTPKPARVVELEMTLDAIEKGGHKHFMLKEILEQPKVLADAMRGRLDVPGAKVHLSGLEEHVDRVMAARRIVIAACGTSYHSGLVGEYLIETLARLPVEVEYASEFRYRDPILGPEDILVVISQSGETADTLAAVKLAKEKGALTFGLVNVVGSTIARETDCGAYLHVGPEIGVASTKAFTGQVVLLTCLALYLAKAKGSMSDERIREAMTALQAVPEKVAAVLEQKGAVYELCKGFRFASSFLYMGRGFNFPVALEGALKLKEISYIHAEGYAAAEMKHGPIALIDKMMPVVFLAPMRDHCYDKVRSNVQEVLARGGSVIVVTEEGNHDFDDMVDAVLYIPATPEFLSPLLTVIPLQLMSYYIADFRKCSIDQPRNLAKSVTVE